MPVLSNNHIRAPQTGFTVVFVGTNLHMQATYWPLTMQKDKTFISDCFSMVQCGPGGSGGGGALIVHCSLCHIHLKSSPLSLPTDTLNDGPPNNTEQIPLCAQVLNISATTVHPPPLPLLFRYLHMSERCGRHKRYSQLSLSPCSVKQADFKAFICLKPLINSAHAASLSLPLLKQWVS